MQKRISNACFNSFIICSIYKVVIVTIINGIKTIFPFFMVFNIPHIPTILKTSRRVIAVILIFWYFYWYDTLGEMKVVDRFTTNYESSLGKYEILHQFSMNTLKTIFIMESIHLLHWRFTSNKYFSISFPFSRFRCFCSRKCHSKNV